ncbi:uncharacterized protein LOC111071879 [Drosophila obscura]|uniref:uncharacterized protein LOC111071879 n=1 Tax=Drosophila obscura TaxID=7282 RepID=UPI001BB12DA5|nr:uncharacterized protein LOC111071879 [Drosophila obscura]
MANPNAISNNPRTQEDQGAGQLQMELKKLVLWRNIPRTMFVFTSILILLVDIMNHSAISVVSMLGITVILGATGYRVFVEVMELWNRRNNEEEYYSYRFDVLLTCNIPQEETMRLAGVAVAKLNAFVNKMIELLLMKDLCESFKLLAGLFFINMLGDYFNVTTLLLIGHILLFTLPKLYELRKTSFDKLLLEVGAIRIQEVEPKAADAAPVQGAEHESFETELMAHEAELLAREAAPHTHTAAKQEPNEQEPQEESLKEQDPVANLEDNRKKNQDLKFLAMFEEVHDPDCSCVECDLLDVTLMPKQGTPPKEQNLNYFEAIEEQHDPDCM